MNSIGRFWRNFSQFSTKFFILPVCHFQRNLTFLFCFVLPLLWEQHLLLMAQKGEIFLFPFRGRFLPFFFFFAFFIQKKFFLLFCTKIPKWKKNAEPNPSKEHKVNKRNKYFSVLIFLKLFRSCRFSSPGNKSAVFFQSRGEVSQPTCFFFFSNELFWTIFLLF